MYSKMQPGERSGVLEILAVPVVVFSLAQGLNNSKKNTVGKRIPDKSKPVVPGGL